MNERHRTAKPRRPYRLQKRAESQEATRLRITEAMLELHASIGPARTTVTEVARRAGVQRLTVYRNFPDELSMLTACSGLHAERYPVPDPEPLTAISDPDERLRAGLGAIYAYFRRHQDVLRNIFRDAEVMPNVKLVLRHRQERVGRLADVLLEGRQGSPALVAAIRHAIAFPTWDSLCGRGRLSDEDAIDLMAAMVRGAA